MNALLLPIRSDDLTSLSSLGIVATWMLAPEDDRWRRWLLTYYAALEGQTLLRRGELAKRPELVDDLVSLALAAPSLEVNRDELERRFQRGFGAGMILYNARLRIERGEAAPVGRSIEDVGKAIWGRSATASKHVNDAVWKSYRPVAALWATYIAKGGGEEQGKGGIEPSEFPCRTAELPLFLGIAEQMREQAERTVPPRRAEPLLRAGESVVVSDEVRAALPSGTLTTVPKQSVKDERSGCN